jgi:hypothetical protein
MSDAAASEIGEPDRLTSLPRAPLAPQQVREVKKAIDRVNGEDTTVWVGQQPESATLDRGIEVLTSDEATVLEFVVECSEAYRAYRYEPAPSGGHWMRFEAAKKGAVGGDIWEQAIEEESYTRLADLVEDEGDNDE